MTFADLLAGEAIFLDANTLVYHFGPHPVFGPACNQLLHRIENSEVAGFTSTPVLSELAHRLMTFEAAALFGWPSKVVDRLKQNPSAVGQLTRFRQALAKVPQLNVKILTIPESLVETAAGISQQTGLLSNDALIVAVMQANGLTRLASHDAVFDRVSGLTRYAPA
jgi:predicted nucleic acid-binding protein